MRQTLQLGDKFTLPADIVLQKRFILAKTGAGKSTAAADFVEEFLDQRIQNVILDPKGDWWGIRSSADGKGEGYPVHVLGGLHGDLPLDHHAGAHVGRWLSQDSAVNAVLDLSSFTKGQLYQFVADFGEAFYDGKRSNPTPVDLVFEEIHEVAPQDKTNIYGPNLFRCLEIVMKIFSQGRFIGIGPMGVSQRSARVNKNVLTQADMLIAMRTTHPLDIKTIDEWLQYQGDQEKRKELLANIQSLQNGEAYVYAPELGVFKRTKFRMRRTFDSGQTPKLGEKRPEPRVLAKVDLDKIRGEMARLVEKAKADDPKHLRAELAKARAELVAAKDAKPVVEKVAKEVEVAVLKPREAEALERAAEKASKHGERLIEQGQALVEAGQAWAQGAAELRAGLNAWLARKPSAAPKAPTVHAIAARPSVVVLPTAPQRQNGHEAAGFKNRKCERAILTVLAQFPEGCESGKLTLLAGYTWSGSFSNAVSNLRGNGWLIGENSGVMRVTKQGLEALGEYEQLPTGDALKSYWLNHKMFGKAERAILAALFANPAGLAKQDLCEKAGYEWTGDWSGSFSNAVSALRTCGVLVGRNSETMCVNPELMAAVA